MPSFSLTLEIDTGSLRTILEAGEKIVVVKAPGESGTQVAWVAFAPFANNLVSWTSEYALYVRRTQGSVVTTVTTDFPTPSGVAFKLDESGQLRLTERKDFPPVGTYRAFNELSGASDLRFGLVQQVSVNAVIGTERINAQFVPDHQMADFTPDETVIVWLQSNVSVGDTVTIPPAVGASLGAETKSSTVMSRSTEIRFGGGIASATYKYDASVGGFVPASQE